MENDKTLIYLKSFVITGLMVLSIILISHLTFNFITGMP